MVLGFVLMTLAVLTLALMLLIALPAGALKFGKRGWNGAWLLAVAAVAFAIAGTFASVLAAADGAIVRIVKS